MDDVLESADAATLRLLLIGALWELVYGGGEVMVPIIERLLARGAKL